MPPDIRIEPVSPRDGPAIARAADVVRRSYQGAAQEHGLTRENAPTYPAFLEDRLLSRSIESRVNSAYGLYLEQEMIGFVMIRLLAEEGAGEIMRLCVLPEHRGHGLGTLLLRGAEQSIRQRGLTLAQAGVVREDLALCGWYERRGYALRQTVKHHAMPYALGNYEKQLM